MARSAVSNGAGGTRALPYRGAAAARATTSFSTGPRTFEFFVGTVLQYQLHRAACRAAGKFDPENPARIPLHKCDVYRSPEAGEVLRRLMRPGSSAPWQEALRLATNESQLDGSAVRDYFRPLEDWLTQENQRTGEYVGWLYDGDYCKQSIETANLQVSGGYYNAAMVCSPTVAVLLIPLSVTLFLVASRV
ncbi:angiotensin-converting enzyme-like [Schistocerca piceifrons]|uniref:angiotensin-converting enzyme-like n=1 Tax=Schistocerca piceifrons TaxID=274613 RepID=UPI001F5FD73C|nr:angiotensin-converting enzyme-like [Schistocerca piceifrons]